MSNIPDITSISDILTTSPSQPTSPSKQNPSPLKQSHTKSQTPENAVLSERLNTAITKQNEKLTLAQTRTRLLSKRAQLKDSIEKVQSKLSKLEINESKSKINDDLEDLKQKNDEAFNEEVSQEFPNLGNSTTEDDILKQMNVLPSNDWDKRLTLIRKFFPLMEIDKINTNLINQDTQLLKTINFKIIFPLVFKFSVNLQINLNDNSIHEIAFDDFPIFLKHDLKMLEKFQQDNNLSLVIYSLNSYVSLLSLRIQAFIKLIHKYPSLIQNKSIISDNKIKNYATLKNKDHLTLVKDGSALALTFNWKLTLNDEITGEVTSFLKIYLAKNGIFSTDSQSINKLFLSLVDRYGVFESMCIIIDNVYK